MAGYDNSFSKGDVASRPWDFSHLRRGFAARRADLSQAVGLLTDRAPRSGDLVRVRIDRIGHHRKLETPEGRRAELHAGDEVVLAYADRYATDQFHAEVPHDLSPCHLIAAGGLAGQVLARHASTRVPTAVTPLGLLHDAHGEVLNLSRFARRAVAAPRAILPPLVVVVGAAMNAGKTTTAASIIAGARRQGLDVAAIKATGTGAGCDMWKYLDAGASLALDFGDAGYASTFRLAEEPLFAAVDHLLGLASGADLVVCELADGIMQAETHALLERHDALRRADGVVFAAVDPLSALSGTAHLRAIGIDVSAVSGAMTASSLAMGEARAMLDAPVLSVHDIVENELSIAMLMNRGPLDSMGHAA